MAEEWITFTEALHRMKGSLRMGSFTADPLLRSVIASGRVAGRGEIKEKGEYLGPVFSDESRREMEANPDVMQTASGAHYSLVKRPAEVKLSDFKSWVRTLKEDDLQTSFIQAPKLILPSLRPSTSANQQPAGEPPGRKRVHDWEGALLELFRLEIESGTTSLTQAALVRHLEEWFQREAPHQEIPALSQIKERAQRFQKMLRLASA